ncbi:MAG: deoxyribodipyrimidine photo-lyase [Chloroflexota bacterium]
MNARITELNSGSRRGPGPVIYWMQRSQRSHSSPALNTAIEWANELKRPVMCYFGLDDGYPHATLRSYTFLLEGLRDVAHGLAARNVGFVLRMEPSVQGIASLATEVNAALVVTDESHLRFGRRRREEAARAVDVPLLVVDNDLLVPVRALGREHYAARTIRPVLHRYRDEYLEPMEDLQVNHPHSQYPSRVDLSDIETVMAGLNVDRTVPRSTTLAGGEGEGRRRLERFVSERLERYHLDRNNAAIDATSGLSPYLHFGHIDPWTVISTVQGAEAPLEAKNGFLEELLIRRELAANFTHYNPRYSTLAGLPDWARRTLAEHTADPRPALYSRTELEEARTGDPLWNAGQRELMLTGSMHNWVRMYWGKRILLWTRTPDEALAHTLYLNNRFALDGRDPVSYTNILWCYGKHDRPWPSHPVYGSVRTMTESGARRKFNVDGYIARVDALQQQQSPA